MTSQPPSSAVAYPPDALSSGELTALSTYNAERWRGLVHTAEYAERMEALQARFDRGRDL